MSPDVERAPGDDRLLAGWGGTSPSRARVVTPLDDNDVGRLLDVAPPRGVIAAGSDAPTGTWPSTVAAWCSTPLRSPA